MTVWRTSWREHGYESHEQHQDHTTEGEAMKHAERLARVGVLAYVYPIGGVSE